MRILYRCQQIRVSKRQVVLFPKIAGKVMDILTVFETTEMLGNVQGDSSSLMTVVGAFPKCQ